MGKHRNSNSHSSKQSQRIIRNGLKVQRESFKKQQEAGDGDDDAVLALQLKACIPIAFSLSSSSSSSFIAYKLVDTHIERRHACMCT